jgi:hypothetical protein
MTYDTYGNKIAEIDDGRCRSIADLDAVGDIHVLAQGAGNGRTTLGVEDDGIFTLRSNAARLEG